MHSSLLNHGKTSKAIEMLQEAVPYELGAPLYGGALINTMYPVWVRGKAYLTARQGKEAAAEFQKIVDHNGILINQPIGALGHLGLGRAYALQGEWTKARSSYQNFLTLWKDADSGVPVLKEANAECAKLQ